MNMRPVGDCIRIAEPPLELLFARDINNVLAGDGIHHHQALNEQGVLFCCGADAECIEYGKRIGCDLKTDANFAVLARLLQHQGTKAMASERQRRSKATDATTANRNRKCIARVCHLLRPPWGLRRPNLAQPVADAEKPNAHDPMGMSGPAPVLTTISWGALLNSHLCRSRSSDDCKSIGGRDA